MGAKIPMFAMQIQFNMKWFSALPIALLLSPQILLGQAVELPLHDIKFSHEIAKELEDGKLGMPTAACYYTYIGKYKQAAMTYELESLDWGLDTLTRKDSLAFLQYKPVNAFEYLADRLRNEQIVIVSEAHQSPQHRVFTRKLLRSLHENGFRHLGIETLTPGVEDTTAFLMDTLLNTRGYPLNSPVTGMYTCEPQMANLIREAIAMGFKVFGYEKTSQPAERDLQQALNIKRYMDLHPGEKIAIHCGWYHAIESAYPKRKDSYYMAYHLKRLKGINPYTIYQDALTEKWLQPESPFYKTVAADEVSVLLNEDGQAFNGVDTVAHFDVLVYHPGTKYYRNRPDWLHKLEGSYMVEVDRSKMPLGNYPVMVQAKISTDDVNATPLDRIELESPVDETPLLLRKGVYKVKITDKNGAVVEYLQAVPIH
jgi:hypothetical protein